MTAKARQARPRTEGTYLWATDARDEDRVVGILRVSKADQVMAELPSRGASPTAGSGRSGSAVTPAVGMESDDDDDALTA